MRRLRNDACVKKNTPMLVFPVPAHFFVRRGVLQSRVYAQDDRCLCKKRTSSHFETATSRKRDDLQITHVFISKRCRFLFLGTRVVLNTLVCLYEAFPHTERSMRVKNQQKRRTKHTHD